MVGLVASRGLRLTGRLVLPLGFVLPLRLELAPWLGLSRLGSPGGLIHAAILGLAARGESTLLRG